jgi:hypothetical protein
LRPLRERRHDEVIASVPGVGPCWAPLRAPEAEQSQGGWLGRHLMGNGTWPDTIGLR